MHEVLPNLYVGSAACFDKHLAPLMENDTWALWSVVHAAKEPYHRETLGYTTRAAPKDHPEYLFAFRGHRLFMNLVDAADPAYIPKALIDVAILFMEDADRQGRKLMVHCNQGRSRSPTLLMLLIAPLLPADFTEAEEKFKTLCPDYAPADGMRIFAMVNWLEYHSREFGRAA